MRKCCIAFIVTFLMTFSVFASERVRTIPKQSKYDASHSYFIGLIKIALRETKKEYGPTLVEYTVPMQQGRAFMELKVGKKIDIYWAGTSLERERDFLTIRIPLVKGLLGFRQGIIRKDFKNEFSKIKTLNDLKHYRACQGLHWPDSDILQAGGLRVTRNAVYENMFRQVIKFRCHYFPRGVHEGLSEMRSRTKAYPELMLYQDLIIYYPFPMYFFLNKKDKELGKRIQTGLERAISKGDFDQLIKEHPVTSHLYPLKKWIHAETIILDNPFLAKDTPIHDSRYWILPPKLKKQMKKEEKSSNEDSWIDLF